MSQHTSFNAKAIPRSLKALALKGSLWTVGGYGLAQLLRFASNVILAKLLFPEAFGLMVLVAVFMQGISLFSDIGITPSIIQNKRGEDPVFLNTAWTIQVIRGFIIWIVACIGVYPYSVVYNEPLLIALIPIAGLSAIIAGFNSTSLATANRNVNLRKLTLLELIAQSASIFVMVGWVLIHPTVWGLVAGGLISAVIKMLLSHFWMGEIKNKLYWDRECAGSLFRFGRWILLSTALTFFAAQIDRLLLGALLGTAMLGIYSIAMVFNDAAINAIRMIVSKVLFPVYSEVEREGKQVRLNRVLRKTHLVIIGWTWLGSILLMFLGPMIINSLYDERYSDAAWMLQILPLSALVGCLVPSYQSMFLAKGKSNYIVILLSLQLIIQVLGIAIGYHFYGLLGIIVAQTMVPWLVYPANAFLAHRRSIWQPKIDFPVLMTATLSVYLYAMNVDFLY